MQYINIQATKNMQATKYAFVICKQLKMCSHIDWYHQLWFLYRCIPSLFDCSHVKRWRRYLSSTCSAPAGRLKLTHT